MGKKTLYAYLGSIIGGALLFGFIINTFLPREWFLSMNHMAAHNHSEFLPEWLQVGSSIVLGILILNAFRIKLFNKYFKKEEVKPINTINMDIKVIKVQGMTCNHCKATVEKGIMGIPGIKEVDINLQQEKVTISADNIDLEKVKQAVEGLGYSYAGEY